jgi:hypothetical protein
VSSTARWTEEDLKRYQARSASAELPGTNVIVRGYAGAVAPISVAWCHAREMNRTEAEYSQLLELRRLAGEIKAWGFERMKLRLADRCWFIPDFDVIGVGGELEFHEVKGRWRDDARVKIKVAAEQFPQFRFTAWYKARKRDGGGWKSEAF